MAGETLSFVASPRLTARIRDIARSDGVTPSKAAARAAALGAMLPAAARRTLRFVLTEGDEDARKQLTDLVTKAVAQVGNATIERQLLAQAQKLGPHAGVETEDELAEQSVRAVADYRREQAAEVGQDHDPEDLGPAFGHGD